MLGSLLLNIFINHMFYGDLESEIYNFVDDTTSYACDTSTNTIVVKLEDDLQKLPILFQRKSDCVLNQQNFR